MAQTDPSNVSSPGSGKVHSPTVPVGGKFGDQGDFKNPRDDARRKQHNEVERRRRDKINTWIARLAKIVPECSDEAKSSQSKGGILAKAHQHILNLQRDNQELVKKINSTPLIPAGASPDEAYAIQLQARDNEIQRLQRELKEAHDDRDDIIEQLKQQGITLATRPEDVNGGFSDEETPSQAKSRQTEQDRIMAEFSQRENERIQQYTHDENSIEEQSHNGAMQIQSSGNGVVIIGSNDYN